MNASAHHLLEIVSSPIQRVQNLTSEIVENGLQQIRNMTIVPIQEKIDDFSNQTATVLHDLQPKHVLNKLSSIVKPSVENINSLGKVSFIKFDQIEKRVLIFLICIFSSRCDQIKTGRNS